MISIIGFGSFGTSIGYVVSRNMPVKIYTRDDDDVTYFNENQMNKKYLTNTKLNDNISVTSRIEDVLHSNVEILILCIPSQQIKVFLNNNKDLISSSTLIVNTAKGLAIDEGCNISQLIHDILPSNPIASIQGPSFAQEIVCDHPTEIVVGCASLNHAKRLQQILTTSSFTVTLSDDILAIELAGALKNVYAIGAGLITGKAFGNNTLAKFVTHAFQEQSELLLAVSGKSDINVATLGDLVMTCYGSLSRNKAFGVNFAKGEKDMNPKTIEGVATIKVAIIIADKYQVPAPILRSINEVLESDPLAIVKLNNLI